MWATAFAGLRTHTDGAAVFQTVSHEQAGPYMLSWSAHVSAPGTVMVAVRNLEEVGVDLPLGRLTVAASRYG